MVIGASGWPLPRAGMPGGTGAIRTVPEDFQVDEVLGFDADGEGEHVLVHVAKRGLDTVAAARRLAAVAGVAGRDVGYCGLKDRHAVARQWFSVRLAGRREPDWDGLSGDLEVLSAARHRRKLRRGILAANRFRIRVRALDAAMAPVEQRLRAMAAAGVPNYFGEQRFGPGARNVRRAAAGARGGIYLSAARAWLFNHVLAARVAGGSWDRVVDGDVVVLEGSRSCFRPEPVDAAIRARAGAMDLHPSGPLWGPGGLRPAGAPAALEAGVVAACPALRALLAAARVKAMRRPLRVRVSDLTWNWSREGDTLELAFRLPPGAYATAVLREVVACEDAAQRRLSST